MSGSNIQRNGAFVAHQVADDSEEGHVTTSETHGGAFAARANAESGGLTNCGTNQAMESLAPRQLSQVLPSFLTDRMSTNSKACLLHGGIHLVVLRPSSQPPATRSNDRAERSARLTAAAAHIRCLILSLPRLARLDNRQLGVHTWSEQLVPLIWRAASDDTYDLLRQALAEHQRGQGALATMRGWWIEQEVHTPGAAIDGRHEQHSTTTPGLRGTHATAPIPTGPLAGKSPGT